MKLFVSIFFFLLFAFFKTISADETCTTAELQNISLCYQKYSPDGYLFSQKLSTMFDTSHFIYNLHQICERKNNLNKCIGNEIIQKCFNIKNMSNLPFLNSTDAAKFIIADFLKDDYVCQKVFNFTDNDALCFNEKLPKSISKICKRDYSSCAGINEFSNCITKLAYKKCRKYVACFVQKVSTLEKCSYSTCDDCDSISLTKNPITDLCNDDKNSTLNTVL